MSEKKINVDHLKIPFGTPITNTLNGPLIWDNLKIINGHIIIVGASGTGKTYKLRQILASALEQSKNVRFHVIDVHGDLAIPGSDIVNFSESSGYGLNPLKVSPDPEFGGVRKRIRSFIAMLNNTSRKLGTKQEAVLGSLLQDLYTNRGFIFNNPETWKELEGRRSNPTLDNLHRFSDAKLQQMIIGAGSKAILSLNKLNKKFMALDRANTKAKGQEDVELENLKGDCKKLYEQYINEIETGREIEEIIKYNSKDVLQSVHERLTNVMMSGIFKSTTPPFKPNSPIKVYSIQSLHHDEQKMFVDVLLEDLFFEARRSGVKTGPDTFIVIDEAHKFVSENDEHVLNLIAKEARKFGLGLILASQGLQHFPDDIVSNAASKIILGVDEMFCDQTAKKIKIDPKKITSLIPHKTLLAQIKNAGDLNNNFQTLSTKI